MPARKSTHTTHHKPAPKPELSIIVPVLNEAETLPVLLRDLLEQRAIHLEIIIVDGGSRDKTLHVCKKFSEQHPNIISYLQTAAGRALQMNEGAGYARAKELLFLHADTGIEDYLLLRNALDRLKAQRSILNTDNVAGHFGLRFQRQQTGHEQAWYFYEAKTHLNRPDTINGDQGMLMSAVFFRHLGQFDESLPYMEDPRLAHKIFQQGHWITLPGVVTSSARRFESEGFKQRQILNSFLCNFQHIGLTEFFTQAQLAYRAQHGASALRLRPFLSLIHNLMMQQGILTACQRWYRTGAYIADNAWQLAFALDCKQARSLQQDPGEVSQTRLHFYDKRLARLITAPPSCAMTALLTLIWFYSLFITEK